MQPKKQHKRKYAASIGGIFIIFAAIGVIALAVFSIRLTLNLLDNQKQKTELEQYLTPVVMFDPANFQNSADLSNQRLLLYSMWTTLASDKALTYSRSEANQTLLVPKSDLEASLYTLFRGDAKLVHETFNDGETVYFYDINDETYQIPTYNFLYVYKPEVMEIKKDGELYQVLVKFIPPDNAWNSIYRGASSLYPDKMKVFILDYSDNSWCIKGIQDPPDELLANIPGATLSTDKDSGQYIPPENSTEESSSSQVALGDSNR